MGLYLGDPNPIHAHLVQSHGKHFQEFGLVLTLDIADAHPFHIAWHHFGIEFQKVDDSNRIRAVCP